jgi:hypothetical protein
VSTANVHLELLLGKLVRDPGGAKVGRIFSVLGEIDGEDCVVREYGLGTASLLVSLGISVTRILGLRIRSEPLRVPWDLLDLADPEHPRLRCPVDELEAKRRKSPSSARSGNAGE